VAGVGGRVTIFGVRNSGRGSDDELRRGSAACRSRRGGRLGLTGVLGFDPEDCGLVREDALADFVRVSDDKELGPLGVLLPSFALLVRAEPGVVVLLRIIFCCVTCV